MESLSVQSRTLEAKDLKWIRRLIDAHPGWNRTKLSEHIAQRWEWRNEAGQLKDMACRSMLLKLERKGLICCRPARSPPITAALFAQCFRAGPSRSIAGSVFCNRCVSCRRGATKSWLSLIYRIGIKRSSLQRGCRRWQGFGERGALIGGDFQWTA